MLSILTSVCSALIVFRLPSRHVLLLMVVAALFGTLNAEERVAIELGGYKLGSYYAENEEQTEPGPMKLKKKVFGCDRVYVEYDNQSRLRRCRFVPPEMGYQEKDCSKEVQLVANEISKRFPFLEKSGDGSERIYLRDVKNGIGSPSTTVTVFYQKGNSGVSIEICENSYYRPLPPLKKHSTPITNLFGVALGGSISNVNVQVKKLEKETLGCQYSFTPAKQFRTLNKYYLNVKDGVVVGIYGVETYPRGRTPNTSVDNRKKDIAELFKQKYGIRFVWGDRHERPVSPIGWSYTPLASRRETICGDKWPWYRGIGDDFTSVFIKEGEAIIEGRRRECFCVALETDIARKNGYKQLEGVRLEKEKSAELNEKRRKADLDAL